MDTVIETNNLRATRLKAVAGLGALREVAKLQPNVAIVRTRTAQDGRAEVSRG